MNTLGSIRYNNNQATQALTNDALKKLAPSIFAEQAATDRSHRYSFIPTYSVVDALRNEGFYPVKVMESRARIDEKKGFTKHLIRFRRHDGFTNVGEVHPELVLMNSHDGTSSYQLSAGLFRLVCQNGLIVADTEIETIKIRHSGNVIDNVIEGTYSIIKDMPEAIERVNQFQGILLPEPAQKVFAQAALQLRYEDDEAPIQSERLNRPQRMADKGNDLWSTFNRVQENIIRGGVRGRNKNGGNMSTRAVNSVGENIRLNKALWTLADEMAKIML
jgi:hypothetical protein